MDLECDLTISLAATGNSLSYLGGGWARAEPSFTWCVGAESHLLFSRLKPAQDYILTLDVIPFIHNPELRSQRLIVSVNDTVVGSSALFRPTQLGYRIPASLACRRDKMLVTLRHPDAVRPIEFGDSKDDRQLAFSVSEARLYRVIEPPAADDLPVDSIPGFTSGGAPGAGTPRDLTEWATSRTGMTIPQIALKFESLGENCEFGLFQRRCDVEPLGLLRFSSTFPRNLIRGIENGFENLGEVDTIEPRLEGGPRKEYMIHEKKYGLVYHTFVYEGQRSPWQMREQESARLKFLRRKFMEELAAGEKIFVYKFNGAMTKEEILPLHMALNRGGPATMLWVVPAEPDRPTGTVEVVMPGLLKGYIDRFAPESNAHDFSFEGWLQVCANACILGGLRNDAGGDEAC